MVCVLGAFDGRSLFLFVCMCVCTYAGNVFLFVGGGPVCSVSGISAVLYVLYRTK